MQGFEKRDESCRLRRAEVLAVGRHVATALDDLPEKLILGQSSSNVVERRTTLAAFAAERMAITTLHGLNHDRALKLNWGATS